VIAAPPADFRDHKKTVPTRDPLEAALVEWRDTIAYSHRVDPEAVLPRRSLKRIVRMQPTSVEQVAELVDAVFAQRYGVAIVDMVQRATSR
jgi:ribonuclease D